jgi:Tol biopolymer transport system component
MCKKLKMLFFLCLYVYAIVGCTSQKPPIAKQGIEQLGPSGYGFRNPVWSPDGTKIAVTTQTVLDSWTSIIYVVDITTDEVKKIMETDNGSVLAVSWSPDGNWIMLASQKGGDWLDGIWRIDTDGKSPPEFLTNGYDAAWSPDGKRIAVFTHSEISAYQDVKVSIIDLETKDSDVVFGGMAGKAIGGGIAWSPSGEELIFDYGQPGMGQLDLYVLNIAAKEAKRITEDGENYNPSWEPGETLIVYVNDPGKGYDSTLIVADKNNICQQKLLTLDDLWGSAWSPGGEQIAFISWGEVYLLSLNEFPAYDTICP